MTDEDAVDALAGWLETMPDRPVTIYENSEIPAEKPFLIFENIPASPERPAFGLHKRLRGTLQITVVVMGGEGHGEATRLTEALIAHFAMGLQVGRVRIDEPPYTDKGYPDAGLWRQPVKVRWQVLPD